MKSLILLCAFFIGIFALSYIGPIPENGKHKIVCDKILSIEWFDINPDNNTNYDVSLHNIDDDTSYAIKFLPNNPNLNTMTQDAMFPCSLPAGFYLINITKLDNNNNSLVEVSSPIFGLLKNEAGGCYKQVGCNDLTGECDQKNRQISYLCCPVNKTCTIDDVLCQSEGLNIPNVDLKDIKIKTVCAINLYGIDKNFNENTQINSTSKTRINMTSDLIFDAGGISSGIYPLLTSSADDIILQNTKVINDSPLFNLTFQESNKLVYDKTIFYLEAKHLLRDLKTTTIVLIICAGVVLLIILGCLYYHCCYKKEGKCGKKGGDYEKEKELKV